MRGSFPREKATTRDSSEPWPLKPKTGHAVGLHLRLEAILNTSPLGCGFVPPSPSRSCSALSMLSRSCSSWSSSLHKKDQKLPWRVGAGGHILPQGPTCTQHQWILRGRTSTRHGVSLQHLSCPLGNSLGLEELSEADTRPTRVAFC